MASSKGVRDLLKQQTLKEPKLVQLDRALYRWFTAVRSKGKPMTGPVIIKKAKSFYDEMEVTDKYTFSKGGNKNYLCELRSVWVLSDNLAHLMIWHLSSPLGVGLREFYYTSKMLVPVYQITLCLITEDHSVTLTTAMTSCTA
jgi:hypothetical protein